MLKKGMLPLILFLIAGLAASADAREWTIVGPRALGMGGAGVAVANDASADYWNPAAYGFFKRPEGGDYGSRKWSVFLDAGAGAGIHDDLGEEVNRIANINFSEFSTGTVPAQDVSDFIAMINNLQQFKSDPNRALNITMHGAIAAEISSIGVGGYVFSDVSARGNLDLINIAPIPSGTTITAAQFLTNFTNPANYGCTSGANCSTATLSATSNTVYANYAGGASGLQTFLTTTLGWSSSQAIGYINATSNGLSLSGTAVASPAQLGQVTTSARTATSTTNAINASGGTAGSFADNTSNLVFKGIAVGEVPITYGHTLLSEDFAIGGNVKYMYGTTYNAVVPVFNKNFQDALNQARKNHMESSNVGLDVGALYRFGDSLRVGIVGRNLNSPKFDVKQVAGADNSAIKEGAQARAGVAYKPWSFLTLAADADLTRNNTTVSGTFKSQDVGGGLEANIFRILQLRAGAYRNIAESDVGFVYTAGIGVNLYLVNIDLGAAAAPQTTKIDNTTIPKEARVELAISSLF